MSTALLNEPADTVSTGFDPDADVAALKATPKEPTQPDPEPAPEPEPAPTPEPDGPTPSPEGGGDGPGDGNNAKASAREFIEVYDIMQSYGFAFYSDGMDPAKFSLPSYAKDRAVHHLAKGLEKMGSPELPWWVGLLIALAPPAGINFMTAKAHRQAAEVKKQEAAKRNSQRARNGDVLHPDSVIHRNGTEQPLRPVAVVKEPDEPAEVHTMHIHYRDMPPCEVCGTPVKRKGKRYCSKSCSGKARAAQLRAEKEDRINSAKS